LTQYLIDLGHKNIAFLGGDKTHGSANKRLEGYLHKMCDNRLSENEDIILEGQFSFQSGVERTYKLLNQAHKPTAIFACNDEIAAGSLFAARFMGIDVPEQLSVVGFEDSPFSRQTWPRLTTAKQSSKKIAQTATQLLISLIRNKDKSKNRVFYPDLVIRDSVARVC